MKNEPDNSMSLLGHLAELRRRLLIAALSLLVGTGIAILFSRTIYTWLQDPLLSALPETSSFITLSPVEGWLVYFKVAIVTSIFATSPLWLYQFWAFIAPGLRKREQTPLIVLGVASALLFIGGAFFCYALIIPHGFKYFVSLLEQTNISLMPQMSMYFSFILRLLIAFGIVFEVPLAIVMIVRWNIISLPRLRKARPYVILIAFILAAIITPPDVFTQIALAIPFIILFEISLLIAWIISRKKSG